MSEGSASNVPPVIVSGSSDDILLVQRGDETVSFYPPTGRNYLTLSPCGLVLAFEFDGEWTFRFDQPVPDDVEASIEVAHDHDLVSVRDYSDAVIVHKGNVDSVAVAIGVETLD